MDPSLVKFLEDDEDESLHSGADVEAFSAALTRDIGGDLSSHADQSHDIELSCQGSNPATQRLNEQWKACTEGENPGKGMQQIQEQHVQSIELHLSQIEQAKQDLDSNEKEHLTKPESSQHLSQEGYSHSDKRPSSERNPSPMFEIDERKITEKISIHHDKQDRTQSSTSQHLHSTQNLNVKKPLAPNEDDSKHGLQQINIQQHPSTEATNASRQMKNLPSIPFHLLMPILRPHLDKDRSMQLQTIFSKLRSNEVSKDDFLRVIKNIVGDQMLRQAAQKLQVQLQTRGSRSPQMNTNLYSLQNQKGHKSPPRPPHAPASTFQRQIESCFPAPDNGIEKTRDVDSMSDGKAVHAGQTLSTGLNAASHERGSPMTSLQAVSKLPQHAHIPQSSFPIYGVTPSNFLSHPYPRPSVGAQAPSQKLQGQVSQTRQALHAQGISTTHVGSSQLMGMSHMPKYEIQNSGNESKRIHGSSLHILPQQCSSTMQAYQNKEQWSTAMSSMSLVKPEIIDQDTELLGKSLSVSESSSFGIGVVEQNEQHSSRMGFPAPITSVGLHTLGSTTTSDGAMQISSSTTLLVSGTMKTPQKKSTGGHKKPLEAPGTSPPSSKKQKTSGAFHDQSIDQLNDVTAVSGVNLREEEEKLLCAPKEESRASEASRRVVQEEEERLVLQRGSLQKKLAEITSKCGLKGIGGDVERCLSLCVEERLRGLVSCLIKLSKQRVDSERARHRFVVTSDVGRQILSINKKIKDDWDKKQAEEAVKLRKVHDGEGKAGSESEDREKDKEKDDGRPKAIKPNREEDDKMRTTAANVAARAAVGGDDMLSKWQLMAEQARQKREGLDGPSSSSHSTKTTSTKSTPSMPSTSSFRRLEQLESEKRGGNRRASRNQAGMHHVKVPHSISVRDVISALEREPQMLKSMLLYRLYEQKTYDSAAEH